MSHKAEFLKSQTDVNVIPCAPVDKSKTLRSYSFSVAGAVLLVVDTGCLAHAF